MHNLRSKIDFLIFLKEVFLIVKQQEISKRIGEVKQQEVRSSRNEFCLF